MACNNTTQNTNRFSKFLACCGVLTAASLLTSQAHAVTIWVGDANGGDGVSFFQEANWDTDGIFDGAFTTPAAGTINTIFNNPSGISLDLEVGAGASSFPTNSAAMNFNGTNSFAITGNGQVGTFETNGLSSATSFTMTDNATLNVQFIGNTPTSVSDNASITFRGGGTGTFAGSTTMDLASDWTGSLNWINFNGVSGSNIIGKITVGGQAAVEGVNVLVVSDSTSSTLTVIPEPSSLALLGLGGLLIARRRRA
ncbi:MAG: PEP-CTERM sorting domain-containing protein [Phycisphaeraceae bacterium]|nr:PEP-CTERM sorting domain-containing protein [Phycisphaeraceae bacterium]